MVIRVIRVTLELLAIADTPDTAELVAIAVTPERPVTLAIADRASVAIPVTLAIQENLAIAGIRELLAIRAIQAILALVRLLIPKLLMRRAIGLDPPAVSIPRRLPTISTATTWRSKFGIRHQLQCKLFQTSSSRRIPIQLLLRLAVLQTDALREDLLSMDLERRVRAAIRGTLVSPVIAALIRVRQGIVVIPVLALADTPVIVVVALADTPVTLVTPVTPELVVTPVIPEHPATPAIVAILECLAIVAILERPATPDTVAQAATPDIVE